MKSILFLFAAIIFCSAVFAKTIGLQYDYSCRSEDGEFTLQVITRAGLRTSVKVDGKEVDPKFVSFSPRLGAREVQLYFLGSPGEDEQNNVCALTYTNAR